MAEPDLLPRPRILSFALTSLLGWLTVGSSSQWRPKGFSNSSYLQQSQLHKHEHHQNWHQDTRHRSSSSSRSSRSSAKAGIHDLAGPLPPLAIAVIKGLQKD